MFTMSITFRTATIKDLDSYAEKLVNEKPTFGNISNRISMWLIKGCIFGILSLLYTYRTKLSFFGSASITTIGSLYDIYRMYANQRKLRNHALQELSTLSLSERMQNRFHRIQEILGLPPARKEMIRRALQLEKPIDLKTVNPPTGAIEEGENNCDGEVIYSLDDFLILLCNKLEPRDVVALARTCTGFYNKMRSINSINQKYCKAILGDMSILPEQESLGINALAYRAQNSVGYFRAYAELASPLGTARGRDWLLLDGVHGGGRWNSDEALPRLELVDLREGKNFQSVYVELRAHWKPDMFSIVLDPKTGWPSKIYCLDSFHGKVQMCDVRVENDRIVTKIVDLALAAMGTINGNWVKTNNGMFVWIYRWTPAFPVLNPQTGEFNIHQIELPQGHRILDIQVSPENNLVRWLEKGPDDVEQWHAREI